MLTSCTMHNLLTVGTKGVLNICSTHVVMFIQYYIHQFTFTKKHYRTSEFRNESRNDYVVGTSMCHVNLTSHFKMKTRMMCSVTWKDEL